MARRSFYTVYVLFKSEQEAQAWEARLPERPAGATEGGDAPPWECQVVGAIRDDRGGYVEGVFRKIAGYDGNAIAHIARGLPDRCYEPRKDGFVWSDLARLAKGRPESFGRYVAPIEEEDGDGPGVIGEGGGGADL